MGDMEIVRQFNSELSTIYETKPPISKAKVGSITRLGVKAVKYYKHVVQSVEKFTQKCRQEYKVPALYVMDSIIRQSRHQFGADKDVFGPRFSKNITTTFQQLFKCHPEDQGRIIKVLNLWQKNGIYSPEIIQPLMNLASANNQEALENQTVKLEVPQEQKPVNVWNPPEVADPGSSGMVTVLQQQQQQHMNEIQKLQQQLQEQQRINQQQQEVLRQKQIPAGQGAVGIPQQSSVGGQPPTLPQQGPQFQPSHQGQPQHSQASPKFQLQPHVLAQIQALTGMNIRGTQPDQEHGSGPGSGQGIPQSNKDTSQSDQHGSNQMPGFPGNSHQRGPGEPGPWGHPSGAPPGRQEGGMGHPPHMKEQRKAERKPTNLLDDFDYGDEQDDASRIAEQRRHLMEEERRLSQEQPPPMGRDAMMEFQGKFRPIGEQPNGSFDRQSPDRFHQDRSPGYHRGSRSPRRRDRSRSPVGRGHDRDRGRWRDRDRDRDREREREQERDGRRDRDWEHERERANEPENQEPERRKDTLSVCTTTIWLGHVPKNVPKEELTACFEQFGPVASIDMIPPRGCAYIQMANRKEAAKAINSVSKNPRFLDGSVKVAWAPAKGVKDRKYKDFFSVNQGVTYIPWDKLDSNTDLQVLSDGGWIDPETLPPALKQQQKEDSDSSSQAGATDGSTKEDLGNMTHDDLMKLAAAQAGKGPQQGPPGQPPPHMLFPRPPQHMVPPPMMIRPGFPGGPPPNMMMQGRPPGMGAPPPHLFTGQPGLLGVPPGVRPMQGLPPGAPPFHQRPPPGMHHHRPDHPGILGRPPFHPGGPRFPPDMAMMQGPPPRVPEFPGGPPRMGAPQDNGHGPRQGGQSGPWGPQPGPNQGPPGWQEKRSEDPPARRPEGHLEMRPKGPLEMGPEGRPEDRPGIRPEDRGMRPERGPEDRPGMRPGMRPEKGPEDRPGMRPEKGPEDRPGMRPDRGPEDRPGMRPDRGPEDRPGMRPEKGPEDRPGMRPDRGPEDRPGMRPERGPDREHPMRHGDWREPWMEPDWRRERREERPEDRDEERRPRDRRDDRENKRRRMDHDERDRDRDRTRGRDRERDRDRDRDRHRDRDRGRGRDRDRDERDRSRDRDREKSGDRDKDRDERDRDRDRDRDRGRDRDRERENRREGAEERRHSSSDLNGEKEVKEEPRKSRFEPIVQEPNLSGEPPEVVDKEEPLPSEGASTSTAAAEPAQVEDTIEAPTREEKEEGEIIDENQIKTAAIAAPEGNLENEQQKIVQNEDTVTEEPKELVAKENVSLSSPVVAQS